jgi:hypothetical protein
MLESLTEKKIQRALLKYYEKSSIFLGCNMFVYDEESDFFVITKSEYYIDLEIKISPADLKRDFTHKHKHKLIDLKRKREVYWTPKGLKKKKLIDVPNKFMFVVPEGMVTVDDIPYYAGLMYVDEWGTVTVERQPQFIHKEKFKKYEYLARKYYNRYIEGLALKLK